MKTVAVFLIAFACVSLSAQQPPAVPAMVDTPTVKVLTGLTSLTWPRFFVHGYLWQCPQSNRIYAVLGEQPRKSRLVEQVVGRMCCHSEG